MQRDRNSLSRQFRDIQGTGAKYFHRLCRFERFLRDALPKQDSYTDEELRRYAEECVAANKAAKRKIPGVGHPIHVDGDPRCEKMFEIARDCGYYGNYSRFAVELAAAAARTSDSATCRVGRAVPSGMARRPTGTGRR